MTYRGRVHNGVVVIDGPPPAEGTVVRVEALADVTSPAAPGSTASVLSVSGTWVGDPAEVDRLLQELHDMKRDELDSEDSATDGDQLRP